MNVYDTRWEMSEKLYIVPYMIHARIIRVLPGPYTYEMFHTRMGRWKNQLKF